MVAKKFLVSAIALLSVTLLVSDAHAQAQPPAGGGNRPGRGQGGGRGFGGQQMTNPQTIGIAFNSVNPTPEQKVKFEDAQIRMQQAMQGLQDVDPQERFPKMREISTKFEADVLAILTEEQKPKYQEELKKLNSPEGRLMGAMAPLNLTAEQKTKIEPIAKETATQLQATMQDQSLQGRDRFTKMQEVIDGFKAKVRPLLNPEQQSQLDQMQAGAFMGMGGRGGRGGGGQRPPRQNP